MKTKYCVGFFLSLFLAFSMLGIGYQIGYQYTQQKPIAHQVKEAKNTEISVQTEGNAVKNEGYYLMEHNDYLVVYLQDKQEVYEYTNIRIDELPKDLQKEIQSGKYVETTEELFGILENYTS